MQLFNPKTLARALSRGPKPRLQPGQADSIRAFLELAAARGLNETSLDGEFIQKILIEILGYETGKTVLKNMPLPGGGNVDAALGRFGPEEETVLAPFELKGAKTKNLDALMPGRHISPVEQVWRYATFAPGARWALVSNYLEVRLYAVGYGRLHYARWSLADVAESEDEAARFLLLLSAENLLGGETARLLRESDAEQKTITDKLYRDYAALRETLVARLPEENPEVSPEAAVGLAQKLLDRVLFIAFAEDKGLLPRNTIADAYAHTNPYASDHQIWDNFRGLFRAVDEGNEKLKIPAYNGGLFRPDPELESLTLSDALCRAFRDLSAYDFDSEVSVTVLGRLFEQSITDLEELRARAAGAETDGPGRRRREGVVYTPDGITAFIVERTLDAHLAELFEELLTAYTRKNVRKPDGELNWKSKKAEREFWEAYRERLRALRVLDPACGSGAFLVAAFDCLHAEYSRANEALAALEGGQFSLFDLDKEILTRNLYGVDLNEESVEITKLSLWLKTARRGKVLTDLDDCVRAGDSLVADPAASARAFDWAAAFPGVFADGGFDVVLGNPPYVRQELIRDLKPHLQNRYEVYDGTVDLFAYFYEQGLKLLKPGGRLGYISSSTFFRTAGGRNLRDYLRTRAQLEALVDFGDVQLFEGVTTYPAILTLRNAAPAPKHSFDALTVTTPKLEDDPGKLFAEGAQPVQQASLGSGEWRFEDAALAALRAKITEGKPTLAETYPTAYRGVLTGLNDAFVIDGATRARLIQEDPASGAFIKPFLEGKDLKKWRAEPRDLYLILFEKGWTLRELGAEDETEAWAAFQQQLPALAAHLAPFAERGRNRTDKGDFWWELRACSYYALFETPKIFYPEISQGAKFCFDESGAFSNNTVYFIPSNDCFLLGLLNSNVIWFYLNGVCAALKGGQWRLRLLWQYMQTLPVPEAASEARERIAELARECQAAAEARRDAEAGVRRRLPDLCPEGADPKLGKKLTDWPALDFAAFRKEIKKRWKAEIPPAERNAWEDYLNAGREKVRAHAARLAELEAELNQEVYALFGLTEAEVKLLEGAV